MRAGMVEESSPTRDADPLEQSASLRARGSWRERVCEPGVFPPGVGSAGGSVGGITQGRPEGGSRMGGQPQPHASSGGLQARALARGVQSLMTERRA